MSAMHVYWSSMFILPARVINEIEQLLRGFLWSQGTLKRGQAKVAWDVVCRPKDEGGLGIRRLEYFNIALMTTHIWRLLVLKESLWVKWIHMHKVRGKSLWEVQPTGCMSWGWWKLMEIRPLVRNHFYYKLGNGHSASAWFDLWGDFCPLINGVTPRMVTNAGFGLTSKVVDISDNDNWKWPATWNSLFPNSLAPILVESQDDVLQWKDRLGKLTNFSVGTVWEDIRPRDGIVQWYHLVWFNHCIPKHSFLLWLAIIKKLKTQDRLRHWDLQQTLLLCPLCELQSDSHSHLFSECPFAKQVWFEVNMKADLHQQSTMWEDIIQDMIPFSKKTSIFSVISKLTLAASVYFIWQERNARLFKKRKRTKEELVQAVIKTIRLKLMTFRFKNNLRAERAMVVWRLPKALLSTDSSS